MKEIYAKLPAARAALPLKTLLEQHGGFCPWCQSQSAYATITQEKRGLILKESVEQVVAATDILRVIEPRVPSLKKSGGAYVGDCPFHAGDSFNVVPAKQFFHCFGCKKSGSAIDFIMEFEHLKFTEAVERLARDAGVALRYEHEGERQFFACLTKECPSKSLPKAARLDELDFLEKHLGLGKREALMQYLTMAGVLKGERLAPSILPGAQARRRPAVVSEPVTSEPVTSEPVASVASEPSVSVAEPLVACTAMVNQKACGNPAKWANGNIPNGRLCDACRATAESFFPSNWTELVAGDGPEEVPVLEIANADELEGVKATVKRLTAKVATRKAFGKDVTKETELLRQAQAAVERWDARQRAETAAKEAAFHKLREPGLAALDYFYAQLTWREADAGAIFEKRALESPTCEHLGYRSNPVANKELLLKLPEIFGWPEVLASGLWQPEDVRRKRERRPNSQFCGRGRIRKLQPGEAVAAGEWADEDGWVWGICEPILIPYRDARGRLLSLRPHKGMGKAETAVGTPHLYLPRGAQPGGEKFATVVITEGEFKAAALWQAFGGEVGVCALPGITFAKHFQVRLELIEWLRATGCRRLLVGFDDEEKAGKPLTKRNDVQKWSRYLAESVNRELKIPALQCVLRAWRVNGKADWDGAAEQIVKKAESRK